MRRCALCFLSVLAAGIAVGQTVTKVTVSPTAVVGGASATGSVTLSKKAGSNGAVVSLSSANTTATVPSSVTVPSGSTSATFTVSTTPVAANATATIKAKLGTSTESGSFTVDAPTLTALTLGASSATGASIVTGTVTIGSAAPTVGISVSLSSSSGSASVPSIVTVAAGNTSASFSVSTKAVTASATAKITAKLSTKSEVESLTLQPQPKLAGTYSGSFFSATTGTAGFTLGPVSLTISATGAISGTATDYGPGSDGEEQTLSGTAMSNGQVSITSTQSGTSNANSGVWVFNSTGDLVVQVENNSNSSNYTCVTLSTSGHAAPFAGSFTGSLVDVYGYGPYVSSFSISSSGACIGTAVPLSDSVTGSYSGSLNSSGVGTLNFTSAPGGTSYGGAVYTAFTPGGLLVGYLAEGYTISLAKSYAGVHTITFGTGSNAPTADIAVSDTGIVTGLSIIGGTPCLLAGTVSSAGVLNVTATSVGSGTPESLKLTGSLVAVLSAASGSGTFTGSDAGYWTSSGKLSSGLIYAGTYSLKAGADTLTFTVDEGGSISGTGSGGAAGAIVTGGVLADGTILILATPTSVSKAIGAATFSGTLSLKTLTSVTGLGTYTSLNGGAGSWTVTGTRG